MEKLIITGSEGKIGTIIKKPLSDLYEVHQVDQIKSSSGKSYQADISDFTSLRKVFETIGNPMYVIHIAADSRVDAPWESVVKNNIMGTRNVYECARLFRIKRLVFASSNHVTGGYEGIPPTLHKQENPRVITVNDPVRPDGDYGNSKLFGEGLARQYYELYGIQSICLRIGTVTREDNPHIDERTKKTWLSHRDLIQLIKKSLEASVEFGIYYGVSNNSGRFWNINNAQKELDYEPIDDASSI